MRKKQKKSWPKVIAAIPIIFLLFQGGKTWISHYNVGEYAVGSWEIVWPVVVSTLIAILGTLVTSYVFLKDAMDRTIDEKPYYGKVIARYRQEKVAKLMWYSYLFIGISCYMILFQAAEKTEDKAYDVFLYIGVTLVVALLVISIRFLEQCINIDDAVLKSAEAMQEEFGDSIEKDWKALEKHWKKFIDNYVSLRCEQGEHLGEFLEIRGGTDSDASFIKEREESCFIIKFSEWEKLILAFLDKPSEGTKGQTVEQRMMAAADYKNKLNVIQKVEEADAENNERWKTAYKTVKRYEERLEKTINVEKFLEMYRILSDYRDILKVLQDKKGLQQMQESRKENRIPDAVLYMLFLLRFYSALNCLVTLPRVEIFYPSAKLYDGNFYNVRFENTSFRASLFTDVVFARIKMVGSNMAFSKFDSCNFYNADLRDCSLGNSYFKDCLMAEMICENVDMTGSECEEVDLREATFDNSIVVNVEMRDSILGYTSFINCKLGSVDFINVVNRNMKNTNFSKSILKKINFHTDAQIKIPDEYKACNKNYYQDLKVKESAGMLRREKANIWKDLKIETDKNFDMSFSSFEETVAEKIEFQNMTLDSSVFTKADMQKSLWRNISMKGCVMERANLGEAFMKNVDMESCAMMDAVLYKAQFCLVNLMNSGLSGCHASKSAWKCCVLEKSDLSRIDLTDSEVEYSSFRDTIITEAELTYAHFKETIFENANGPGLLSSYSCFEKCSFVNAFLPGSNFNYTIFQSCDLKLSSMVDSTVEEARFVECNFDNANFRGCCFIKVLFKNNKNVDIDIFENCKFIDCMFEGTDENWKKEFDSKEKR